MAQAGQNYTITLQQAHLEWGTHRYTDSRGVVYGEGYIPIPDREARMFNIQNQNGTGYSFIYIVSSIFYGNNAAASQVGNYGDRFPAVTS